MKMKRGANEGNVRRRKDGTWEARFTIGINPNGTQKRKSLYGKSQAEVQKKLRDALKKLDDGDYLEPTKMTVSAWLNIWMEEYGKPRWREKTYSVHRNNCRLHLEPHLGGIPLCKLRNDQIQAFINAQTKSGASAGSVRKRMEPLQGALKQAVKNRLIAHNPAEGVVLPTYHQREIHALSLEEQRKLLAVLPDTTHGRAIQFILLTGLRASELCGLFWSDIESDRITIRRGLQRVDGKIVINPTKTAAGNRVIPLTATMRNILEEQRKGQAAERLRAGSAWIGSTPGKGNTPVFASEVGTPCDRDNLSETFRRYLSKAGLPSCGLHALRHSFATSWVLSHGDIRNLSEILGHSKVAFTLSQYAHGDYDSKLAGLEAIENMR